MKTKLICILIALLITLTSCKVDGPDAESTPEVTPEATPEETPEEIPEATPGETPKETPEETPEETPIETPSSTVDPEKEKNHEISPFRFSSYEKLQECFSSEANAENNVVQYQKERYGDDFNLFVEYLTRKGGANIPFINGEPMPLHETWNQCCLFTKERYRLPWIWYYYRDADIIICLTYFSVLTDTEIPQDATASEVLNAYDSTSPNVHNKQDFGEDYLDIYEKEIQLADRKVTALVRDAKKTRDQVYIFYDGMMINIYAPLEEISDEFLVSLSFG